MWEYSYEPSRLEIILTNFLGLTLLQKYYGNFVKGLDIKENDKVLDFCSGSGIIAGKAAGCLKRGQLIYADVSEKWLANAAEKIHRFHMAKPYHIKELSGLILKGYYDKIIVHFTLHDLPDSLQMKIIKQLIHNLKPSGLLIIREPNAKRHGVKLFRIINLLESEKAVCYSYSIRKEPIVGEYIDIRSWLKPDK